MGGGVGTWKDLMKEVKVETDWEDMNSTRKTKGTGAHSRPQKWTAGSPGHFEETLRGGESEVMATHGAQECGPLV